MTTVGDLKQSALQSAAYDTILQVCLRVVSFVLNGLVLRSISPDTFGICSGRLLLLYSVTLLLTREAIRRCALSAKHNQINYKLVNLIWLGCTSLPPVGGLLYLVWQHLMSPPQPSLLPTAHYPLCLLLMLSCCALELLAELPYVLAELMLWCKTRVIIEGITQLVRSVLMAVVVLLYPSHAVIGYCICHLIGSCVYTGSYYLVFYWTVRRKGAESKQLPFGSMRQLLPRLAPGQWLPEVDPSLSSSYWAFMRQCCLKELLTKGDGVLMNLSPSLVTPAQQGTYEAVSNLGALSVRLVFRSIETAAYKFFAQTVDRDTPLELQDSHRVREAGQFLASLLRGLALLGLAIFCFGWNYSHALLQLYGGSSLSSEGSGLMRAQCALVVLLALNGVTEAYTFAAMTQQQLNRHSSLLVVFSVVYLLLCAVLSTQFGAVGFVLADCCNMALRIAHGWVFISRQYRPTPHTPLAGLNLPPCVMLAYAAAFAVTAASEAAVYPHSIVGHIGVGGLALLAVLYCLRDECRPLFTAVLRRLDESLATMLPLAENTDDKGEHCSGENTAGDRRRENTGSMGENTGGVVEEEVSSGRAKSETVAAVEMVVRQRGCDSAANDVQMKEKSGGDVVGEMRERNVDSITLSESEDSDPAKHNGGNSVSEFFRTKFISTLYYLLYKTDFNIENR